MTLTFQIHYRTEWGQSLCIVETRESILGWTPDEPLCLKCQGGDFWTVTLPVSDFVEDIFYKYALRLPDGSLRLEDEEERHLPLRPEEKQLIIRDFWQVSDYEHVFRSSAFAEVLFRRPKRTAVPDKAPGNIRFTIDLPQVLPTQGVAIIGNCPQLGNWRTEDKLVLSDADFPLWRGEIKAENIDSIEYKYVLYDLLTGQITDLENGENRCVWGIEEGVCIQQNDRCFRRSHPRWKGAGVAIPVFSIRTEDDFGIGEYLDLKKMADWAALTGQQIIQTLPINDTTLSHTNQDSYPYNAVSVFALHPIYLNIEHMGTLSPARRKAYKAKQRELNALPFADYQHVYDEKMHFFRAIYKTDHEAVFASEEYRAFCEKNGSWLDPYAIFMSKRDHCPADFYRFLQYHADRQLREAVRYAHSKGVALKGDIPIGISPESVDASSDPQLFHLDASAGAPPDDFSISGQNWGFPTYNWDEMKKDGYLWWRRRFQKMQDYFDAYRIDHILGFFRIWQMRKTDVWGLCGHFSPALPYTMQDLEKMGITLSRERLTQPFIPNACLEEIFGEDANLVRRQFLLTDDGETYHFRTEYSTQRKVQDYFDKQAVAQQGILTGRQNNMLQGLIYLHCEVLFVEDQNNAEWLHPRIALYESHSFRALDADQQRILRGLHEDYFYHRHNDFWRQSALEKLPALIHATRMLVCGEDLGMVPECVPSVMQQLQILSLEIERMPKDMNTAFAHPAKAPYLSVCTTGTHDTNPLRAWWEEDPEKTQHYYNEQMGWWGEAPREMTPEIADFIVNQHMQSAAMWVILPLQDWLATSAQVRLPDAEAERINVPGNPHHFWKYRMHLTIESLLQEDTFNRHIRELTARRNG